MGEMKSYGLGGNEGSTATGYGGNNLEFYVLQRQYLHYRAHTVF